MRMEICGIGAALALAALGGAPGAGAESLYGAMAEAYRESAILDSQRALLRSQDESVAEAVAGRKPTLTATASAASTRRRTPNRTGSGTVTTDILENILRITMRMPVYDGGDRRLAVRAASELVLASRQTLVEVEQSVLLGAARAYHDVLRQRELLDLERNGLRLGERQLDAARRRLQLGGATRTDVSLVEASVAAARSRVILREGELEIAREAYRLATGELPEDLEPTPPLPEVPATLEEAREMAMQNHPAVERARHAVEAARLTLKRSETATKPRIYLDGAVQTKRDDYATTTDSGSVSLSAEMPLYTGGRASSAFRNALALADRARLDLLHEARLAAQRVATAWARSEFAESSIAASRQQVAAAELAYRGFAEEAELGARTTIELLTAEQNLLEARTNLVSAEKDRDMAVYSLLDAVGLLTARHLGLDVAVYDPEENFDAVKRAPGVFNRRKLLERALTDE